MFNESSDSPPRTHGPSRRASQSRRRSPGPRQCAAEAGKTQASALCHAPRRNRKFLSAVGMIR